MTAHYLIDTVIIIDHLRGITKATEWLESEATGRSVISVITRAEVLAGTDDKDKERVAKLLSSFDCLPITVSVADRAAWLRQKHRWKLPDAFQASLAEGNKLKLVTRNTRDFPPDKHSFVFVPYIL